MTPFADFSEAQRAVQAFAREKWSGLPEQLQAEFARYDGPGVSPVDMLCGIGEALYANRTENGVRNKAARELLGRLASFLGGNGFHGFGDGRGFAITRAMERDNGEELSPGSPPYADPSDDPEIADRFKPVELQAEAPPIGE